MTPDLDSYLRHCQSRVQQLMHAQLEALPALAPRLRQAMLYACMQGGKRIRPVLCFASAAACGARPGAADAAACAVEYMHCYSLIHDDLPAMDDDDLRRGQPTVHRAFDEATAILAGDALQALALGCLTRQPELAAETRLAMIELLAEAGGYQGMVSGQAIDFAAVGKSLSLAELETMHRLKTGALISASVQLGALSAGADTANREALLRYAQCIGLSFQVQDDILDVVGDSSVTGKTQGADQALNKPTYVSLLGIDGAISKAQELTAQAIAELQDFGDDARVLRQLAHYIIARIS